MNDFRQELERVRNRWRTGLTASVLLDLAGGLAVALVVLGLLDLLLALESEWRLALSAAVCAALLSTTAIRLFRILMLLPRDAAVYADRLLKSRRRETLAAFELQGALKPDASPLADFFIGSCIREAAVRLRALPDPFPAKAWRAARRRSIWALAILCVPALLSPRAAFLQAGRILAPYADIPPFSRYVFTVTPEAPRVIYGSDQVVGAIITGAPVRGPVQFVTRQTGQSHETPCFQGSPTNFAQRLERVMQPMEFCFRVGRARSRWHRVTVLLEPHIEAVEVRLTPPAYSLKPWRTFVLGSEPLAGLSGTRVELVVKSNRPLLKGALTVTPLDGISHAVTVAGVRTNGTGLAFAWAIERNARLSVMVTDVLGAPAREPLKTVQELVPDEPPRVTLNQPTMFSLATPSVSIPVQADVQDDLGLRRTDLFRSVMGYRSRSEPGEVAPGSTMCDVTGRLDLARLGVEPGQVIEVLVEAVDTNPDLTGLGASDVARIQIISEEDYAEWVRARTTLDAFRERFSGAAERYEKLRTALQTARDSLQAGELNPDQAAQTMGELETLATETAQGMTELASQFAAYDLEKKLSQAALALAGPLETALANPGWKSNDSAARLSALDAALSALGAGAEIRKVAEQAEETAEVARVMALAAWFKALVDRQELLVRRLERYAAGEREVIDPRVLTRTQEAIRTELETLVKELNARATGLDDTYEPLRTSALDFLWTLNGLDVPTPMLACAAACRNDKAREAWTEGARALEKLRAMLSQCKGSGFGGLCDGALRFKVPGDLSETLAQMLKALSQQYADGVGQGRTGAAGIGLSGSSEGSSSDGYSALDIPVYGPPRSNPFQGGSGATGEGDGAGQRAGGDPRAAVREVLKGDDTRKVNGTGVTLETVPIKYRDAVKSFYSEERP